ncbi:serine/threonine-protein kinase [Chlorogloea sp. CCALA 695]|uniref:serine/threonine-protein kinase n=1 Tax=Chlorogloea sp. CCALA 695 TaxID=2107693 RepID=UPI000D06D584|nr:serine/threonine-protein kinase [Chlorogloea sp. CCALA 695]PSB35410.1 serine/threonine protein kinase [Chlorogloea sp. CCALA 695]
MIDKLLGGRYRIVATLGSGGFSQTYVAEDTHRPGNPQCAVKHLQPANNNQSFLESARRLFKSEAETLEKLGHHDRIPRLLAYFEENQEFYLVQEFIPGELLTNKLQPSQRWTENQVWEFVSEILEILVFIHAQGFIHRDIKPSNIIQRQQDNKLVLVDFGAVKQNWAQLLSQTSNIEMPATVGIGTPGYMPMEQARGRPRPNSDIYALGAIALQALTGLYPMQLAENFETGELQWQQQAQISDALALIITKMVRYHFKDRYESATEVLAEIKKLAPQYLPTKISADPVFTQNTSSTGITTPTFPVSVKPSFNSPILVTNDLPSTTIISPAKGRLAATNRRPYYLTLGAAIGAVIVAVGAGYATYWQPRLQLEQTLEQLENIKVTGKYSECIVRTGTITRNSSLYTEAQNVLHECKLIEAKRLAAKADFKGATSLVNSLPLNSRAYGQAKPLMNQWYDSILAQATDKYQAGKLNEAISLAQYIPSTSLGYQKAQATIKQWQTPIAKNSSYMAATVSTKKVIRLPSTTTKTQTLSYSLTEKIVGRSPKSTASKPSVYPKQATASTKPIIKPRPVVASNRPATPTKPIIKPRRVIASTTRNRLATPTKRTIKPRRIIARTTRTGPATLTKRIIKPRRVVAKTRPATRFSSRKYVRISKKVATNSQVKARTKKVFRRVTTRAKSRQQSYRWTTKTVR